jgi:MFS family permease
MTTTTHKELIFLTKRNPEYHLTSTGRTPGRFYKWEVLVILWICFFLHQGGRQVYNSLIPLMRKDLGLTDVQMGLVATCFTLVYGAVVPFAGFFGDILQKRFIIIVSLVLFSAGNLLTGFTTGLVSLLLLRSSANGTGEAFYFPAANALLVHYHGKTKALALSIHQAALYVGVIVCGWFGAYIGELYGWRFAFYIFGTTGLVFSLVVIARLRNDRTDTLSTNKAVGTEHKTIILPMPSVRETMQVIVHNPIIYLFCISFGGMVFVNFGYTIWMPTFLHEKFSLPLSQAAFHATVYHFCAAIIGIISGARIADTWSKRFPRIRIFTLIIGLLCGAPFIALLAFSDKLITMYIALGLFGLFRGIYESNMFASLFDTIAPKYHSSIGGVMIAFGFAVGALAPVCLGWIKLRYTLELGWIILATVFGCSGIVLLLGTGLLSGRNR